MYSRAFPNHFSLFGHYFGSRIHLKFAKVWTSFVIPTMMQYSQFRVIIIGAGPTGLYMARALHAANIDFIVLERDPRTFRERGNHLLLWPHTARLLHQLGLYDEAKRRSYKLVSKCDMLKDGTVLSDYDIWKQLEDGWVSLLSDTSSTIN